MKDQCAETRGCGSCGSRHTKAQTPDLGKRPGPVPKHRDVSEGAPRKARVTAKCGWCGGGIEMEAKKDRPATELLHFYSALT